MFTFSRIHSQDRIFIYSLLNNYTYCIFRNIEILWDLLKTKLLVCVCVYIYIYIYITREVKQELDTMVVVSMIQCSWTADTETGAECWKAFCVHSAEDWCTEVEQTYFLCGVRQNLTVCTGFNKNSEGFSEKSFIDSFLTCTIFLILFWWSSRPFRHEVGLYETI